MAEPTLVLSDLLGAQGRLDCGPEPINAIRQGTRLGLLPPLGPVHECVTTQVSNT